MKNTSKNSKASKSRIESYFRYWLQEFSLLPSRLSYKYPKQEKTAHGGEAAFKVFSYFPYRGIEISVFPCALTMNKEHLTQAIVHECLHIVLWRNRYAKTPEEKHLTEEECVDLIALVFINHLSEF